jgi:hypothetical protein
LSKTKILSIIINVGKERLYCSVQTEKSAVKLAKWQGYSDSDISNLSSGGGWLEHYKMNGETLKMIRNDTENILIMKPKRTLNIKRNSNFVINLRAE